MEHVVFFTGADGAAQNRRTPSLEEAVRVVEHLRNVEGVEDARVFSMTEVPLSFKTVYRVEIPGVVDAAPAPVAPLPPMPPMPDLVAEASEPAAPVEEPSLAAVPSEPFAPEATAEPVSNGRRGTGFFAR